MTDSPEPQGTPIPVLCDRCRATGMAGDAAFAAIPDILDFAPVPRRAHVNNWTAQHQRAFIAALAITGSPRQAARALGRHMFGAQQLRTARGGKSFDAAWDAAMEIARDREFARIHANLSTLSAERSASEAAAGATGDVPAHPIGRIVPRFGDGDDDLAMESGDGVQDELDAARERIRNRLTHARRLLLMAISGHPAKRAAWEELVGPVDWDRASRCEAQDDEPCADPRYPARDLRPHNFTRPGMILTAEAGLLPELTGGFDALAEVRASLRSAKDAGPAGDE